MFAIVHYNFKTNYEPLGAMEQPTKTNFALLMRISK